MEQVPNQSSQKVGVYIHIPYCKQACHYCDFHFSTTTKKKDQMVFALCNEIKLRRTEIDDYDVVQTIYFGGGTPSLLSVASLKFIIDTIYENYLVADNVEITIEANPDDLTEEKIIQFSKTQVNRLSIGIQSFFDQDLKLMNRAHNADEALQSITLATQYFDNISIDLIYGIPNMSSERWQKNIQIALNTGVPHISSYALTVEPNTALARFIEKGVAPVVEDELAQEHFEILEQTLTKAGFDHYELSNFGKPNFYSQNNTAYWQGRTYLGIGPSAHSYNGTQRSWNINNNAKYLTALQNNELPKETETLTITDRYNEQIMTGLRTMWGVSIDKIRQDFGNTHVDHLLQQSKKHLAEGLVSLEDNILKTTSKGKFLCDGIASDLFLLNLNQNQS